MDIKLRCLLLAIGGLSLLVSGGSAQDEGGSTLGIIDKGYRAAYRLYEDCQQRNMGVSVCLKKKAIAFFDRIGKIDNLPIVDNLELVKVSAESQQQTQEPQSQSNSSSETIEATLGRTAGASRDDVLNEILLDRVAHLMNGFNLQLRLPKTSAGELKRSIEEGRGKMKKMMNMMMMGMAMKMAAMVPIMMMVLFLLAGKALIISKIALVISMIIGLKKLLSQKNSGGDSHGWQSSGGGGGGGWDRRGFVSAADYQPYTEQAQNALKMAYA